MYKQCKNCDGYFLSKKKYYQYCGNCAKISKTFCKLCRNQCLKSEQICDDCANNKIVKALLFYYSNRKIDSRKRGGKPLWFENLYKCTKKCTKLHCFSCYQEISYDECHAGHIFPRHCGGEDKPWNMVPTCSDCERKTGQNVLPIDKKMWKEFGSILFKTNQDLMVHLIIHGILFEKFWLNDY